MRIIPFKKEHNVHDSSFKRTWGVHKNEGED